MLSRIPFQKLPWEVSVLTYEELYHKVKLEMGEEIDNIIAQLTQALQKKGWRSWKSGSAVRIPLMRCR